ncbi:YhcH/YjgK/YiaL family protein [Helicobacter sp. 11S03491-1]|uniref:YhcH/YjgK/YiaL family protein n=1 Tax=Helicobacter sp. 11S03491-1 TaxID=1476196 RepID=UPI000BA7DF73|nr:YhcH/YjgK/YiaL family protein [Helicobacter sp. 11S03491-1]PAF41040.1 hypothetical protein BKH45_08580 [Helicobacter sp. 11S03491-1]
MAIIGKFDALKHLFEKTEELEILCIYLNHAQKPHHPIHDRILHTPLQTENKIPLEAGMWAIEQSYMLKQSSEAFYETHQEYIDFQLAVKGIEYFELGDVSDFDIQCPYDQTKDLIVYQKSLKTSKIRLHEGMLAIFFESDVHAGGLQGEDTQDTQNIVFKTVVKVPKKLIKLKL